MFINSIASGAVFSWGQKGPTLGRFATNAQEAAKPTLINQFPNRIVQIAAGTHHALALDLSGFVYSWGENSFGQLGHGDTNEYSNPKEIELFKKETCVQIYAGGDSSYAITKNGDLYVWGDVIKNLILENRNNQLGIMENYHLEPKLLINTPWEKSQGKEARLIYGKTNQGIFYRTDVNGDGIEKKDDLAESKAKIKELEEKIVKFQVEIQELHNLNFGQSPQQLAAQQKVIKEDSLLKAIQSQMTTVSAEISTKQGSMVRLAEEVAQLSKDLENIKEQLVEISEKENTLISERDTLDNQIRKEMRQNKNQTTPECEKLRKDQKRVKELLQANDNIKNTLIKRQNEGDSSRLKRLDQQQATQAQLKELEERLRLFKDLEVERKKTLKTSYLQDNKLDLEKFMKKIYYFYKSMAETNINEIAKKSNQIIGLEEMINSSNQKLKYIKTELGAFKVNPNDGSYEILSRILEIIQDNLQTRMRLNDYIGGLLLQVSQKNEEYVQNFKLQFEAQEVEIGQTVIKNKQVLDYIMKQKRLLMEKGKAEISIKGYTKDLLQLNEMRDKAHNHQQVQRNRGCLGN